MEAMLLPRNYPESVRPEYLTYVQWTALGLVTGRVQSVLATQAALFAVGAGAGAVPLSAAIQWVLKDGLGHAAAVVYATAVNTRFDADARRYRFQSSVANTVADMIAVAMPLAPASFVILGTHMPSFLVLASLSSATSGIAGVAHAAARARVMASFALRGNLADCTRAGQTQAKLMSLVGTALGIGATRAPAAWAGRARSWNMGHDTLIRSIIICGMPGSKGGGLPFYFRIPHGACAGYSPLLPLPTSPSLHRRKLSRACSTSDFETSLADHHPSAAAGVSWAVGPQPFYVILAMVPLSVLSLLSTYRSCRLVVLRTLNVQRTERVYRMAIHNLAARMLQQHAAASAGGGGGPRTDRHGTPATDADAPMNVPMDVSADAPVDVFMDMSADAPVGMPTDVSSLLDDSCVPSPERIAQDDNVVFTYASCFHTPMVLQPLITDARLATALTDAAHLDQTTAGGDGLVGTIAVGGGRENARMGGWRARWHAGGAYAVARHHQQGGEDSAVHVWYSDGACARNRLQAVWHACVHRYMGEALRQHRQQTTERSHPMQPSLPSGEAGHSDAFVGGFVLRAQDLDRVAVTAWPAVYESMRSHEWEVEVAFLDGDGGCLDIDGPGVQSQAKKDAEAASKEGRRAARAAKER
jgi:hypothetical protein